MSYLRTLPRQLLTILRYPRLFLFAERMGRENRLGPGGRFYHHREIYLGDSIYMAPGFHISAHKLRIGSGVLIGPRLLIECHDHTFNEAGKSLWKIRKIKNYGHVTIEDDVWIGGNVTILKDVDIGEGTVVGASAVVTRSLPPYSVCVGMPCKPVKRRFSEEDLAVHLEKRKSEYTVDQVISEWRKYGI